MSHIATTWAWKQDVENPIRKLVLLFVADAANPERDWNTWHSFRTIAAACNCSVGSVSSHMRWLVDQNYLTLIKQGSSSKETNRYRLNVGEVTVQIGPNTAHCSAAERSDRSTAERDRSSPEQYRSAAERDCSSPERDRSAVVDKPVIEPIREPVSEPVKEHKRAGGVVLPEWMPADLWVAYVSARRSMKRHPMSAESLDLVIVAIAKCREAGHGVDDILEALIENGWRTVKPEWLAKRNRAEAPDADETLEERAARMSREMFPEQPQQAPALESRR